MLRQTVFLWKNRKNYINITLQRRLILFFVLVVVNVILAFTLLLILFGITGSGRQAVFHYLESELGHISAAASKDFGNLSVTGISLAQTLAECSDSFFEENHLNATDLSDPLQIEALLTKQMPAVLSVAENNACGGVFVFLDTNSGDGKKPGIFIKKTQPVSSASLAAKVYYLRGPAAIARDSGIELLGQWKMKYDSGELAFAHTVMETAKEHPELPLSRLYYWSGRVCLNGNSDAGILLCLPLRSGDGTVFGVCGIEVSDRMFKQLYSPSESTYQGAFAMVAPSSKTALFAQHGLIAGNSYLTGSQMTGALTLVGTEKGFPRFYGETDTYGGLSENLKLYPAGSPYEDERWEAAVLIPNALLTSAIKGSSAYLFLIVSGLLLFSLAACVFLANRYLNSVKKGLAAAHRQAYETEAPEYGTVDSLFEDLARDIRARKSDYERLIREKQDIQKQYEKAQTQIDRLADKREQEIDPDEFALFLDNLQNLTVTERKIFDLYLEGKSSKDILEITQTKENTLKYHNRNIYGKLGVTSRKQLLRYAAMMERQGTERKDSL